MRSLVSVEVHAHELVNLLGVSQVRRGRRTDVLGLHRERAAAAEVLPIVGEQVEGAVVRLLMQREQRGPPPLAEGLRLVDDDRVEPWTRCPSRLLQQ